MRKMVTSWLFQRKSRTPPRRREAEAISGRILSELWHVRRWAPARGETQQHLPSRAADRPFGGGCDFLSVCWTANRYDFAFRGFILFLTGFFGPGITSVVPPFAVIFSLADFEKC